MSSQLFNRANRRGNVICTLPINVLYGIIHDRIDHALVSVGADRIRNPSGLGSIDIHAVCQNVCVEIEKKMGIYPNVDKES